MVSHFSNDNNAHLPPYLHASPFNSEEAFDGREWENGSVVHNAQLLALQRAQYRRERLLFHWAEYRCEMSVKRPFPILVVDP